MYRLHHSNGSNLRLNFPKNTENTDGKSLEVTHECYDSAWQDEQEAMLEIYKANISLLSLCMLTSAEVSNGQRRPWSLLQCQICWKLPLGMGVAIISVWYLNICTAAFIEHKLQSSVVFMKFVFNNFLLKIQRTCVSCLNERPECILA